MMDVLARFRPHIRVTAHRDAYVFVARAEFRSAPYLWVNYRGQIAAIGESESAAARRELRRVDLVMRGGALHTDGETGHHAAIFLKYAFLVVLKDHPLRSRLAPRVTFVDAAGVPGESPALDAVRRTAFRAAARAAGARDVMFDSGAAPANGPTGRG